MSRRDAMKPWPGQPQRCTCTRTAVKTLEETLDCPAAWYFVPRTGWVHTFGRSQRAGR